MPGRRVRLLILATMFALAGAACVERETDESAAVDPTPTDAAASPTPEPEAEATPTPESTPVAEPSPAGSDDYDDLEPPPILLRTPDGDVQEGGLGAYCWDFPGESFIPDGSLGVCVDTDVHMLPETPIDADTDAPLEFDLTGLEAEIESLEYAVFRAGDTVETDRPGWTGPVLPYQSGEPVERGDLDPADRVSLDLDLPPDEYAITLSVRADRGDVSQAFYVRTTD